MATEKDFTEKILDFLASVKLAMVLLLVLAAAAIGGTVVPQNLDPHQYFEIYGRGWYTFLSYLDMFDMYSSWWFRLLLSLLMVNLLVCSIKRLPLAVRLAKPLHPERITPDFLDKQSFSLKKRRKDLGPEAAGELKQAFKESFGTPHETPAEWGTLYWAEKGAFSRFGAYIVHFSLFVIMAGSLIGGIYGFSAYASIAEGQTVDRVVGRRPPMMIDLPFNIRLDRFVIKFYDTGMPSEYLSEVTVIENGQEVRKADIRVNHPFTYRGITFYMSGYDRTQTGPIGFKITRLEDGQAEDMLVNPGAPVPIPGMGGTIQPLEYTEDLMEHGPAVKLLIRPEGGEAYTEWAVEGDRPDVLPKPQGPFAAKLTQLEMGWVAGLQVNKDPGVWFIWIGCSLMMVGFIITFLFAIKNFFSPW